MMEKRWLVFGSALLLALLLALGAAMHRRDSEIRFFHDSLTDAVVPPIRIGAQTYRLESGNVYMEGTDIEASPSADLEVLRIAYYVEFSRRFPIFSLDGTDPKAMRSAIAFLTTSLQEMTGHVSTTTAHTIERGLYSFDLFSSLATLQETRDSFLAVPSEHGFITYRGELEKTASAYERAIGSMRRTVATVSDPNASYIFADGYVTNEVLLNSLQKMDGALEKDRENLVSAEACMNGVFGDCPNLARERTGTRPGIEKAVEAPPLTPEIVRNRNILDQAYGSAYTSNSTLAFLSQSSCLPDVNPAVYETYATPTASAFAYVPLNDLYFWELPSRTDKPFYEFQAVTNPYVCSGGADDITRIASMREIRKMLTGERLLGGRSSGISQDIRDARSLEDLITQASDPLIEADFDAYTNDLRNLLSYYGEVRFGDLFGPDAPARAELVISIWTNRSGSFENVLRLAGVFDQAVSSGAGSENPPTANYMFISRSMPKLMLFAFNRSFVDFDISFVQQEGTSSFVKIVSYEKVLQFTLPLNTIINLIAEMRPHIPNGSSQ